MQNIIYDAIYLLRKKIEWFFLDDDYNKKSKKSDRYNIQRRLAKHVPPSTNANYHCSSCVGGQFHHLF